ncbi:polyribonucleotide nucleotidyltransferase [Anaeropeptidivorans aminofermentans]|jgi:polyribonucleotide nucleotidyltransferase|uniref:polyribonucleotide nucleotidyltransferase n=1 Tax=Anaeropeptidivorans aminofermentans TaxID=2934315 RepID=UPI000EEB6075|nr:polyribonucleotide nucleotidyltransferase [Anaeropeptidivorans aminofermentans]HAQ40793.1 polyribonucleotide nucleotidyltransferase [Clostridiales bacterium]
MYKTYSMDLGGRNFSVEIGRVAELANGAAIVRYGDTTVLVAVTASEKPRDGIDFFPLSIDYEEKLYAVGKIPGGFIKREGRPTEKAILTSRLIDRPIRPLFPKDYRNDVSVVATVLSVDQDCSPEVAAMIGSSLALSISDIPFMGPTGSVNVGLVDGQYVLNPCAAEREKSRLSLTVASTKHKVMMIEAGADEVSNEEMLKAIMFGHEANKKIVEFIEEIVKEIGKAKHSYEDKSVPSEVYDKVRDIITDKRMEEAVFTDMKQEREERLALLKDEVNEKLLSEVSEEEQKELTAIIGEAIYKFEKETVRRMILKEHKRPDGRKLDEIRHLSAEVDIVPRVHGSALFSRGQTQVLTITTLGSMGEVQHLDGLDEAEDMKRYMHHYNFPSYSVGETRPSRGPGRREIGHGALAERALLPVIPSEEEFPYAIRLVSEVLSSNGSTSQGSVCGSSLSLMAAGVPIKSAVAGISVGLVTGDEGEFTLLTDIQGIEDFFGDMDFKVAGTKKGITAIQMDIKIDGLTEEIIKLALEDTEKSRFFILDEIMNVCIDKPRTEISEYAPKIGMLTIDTEKMAEVIGSRGKTIKRIIEESGVTKIDTEDDGRIFIAAQTMESVRRAMDIINAIVMDPEPGKIYTGKVTRILNFGAFVEIAPEKEGLVHISQLAKERVNKVEDIVNVGDIIQVKCIEIDDQGRINLSRKAALPQ